MAQRIQNKRSSIAGKRPEGTYLEPGELAFNTNASDPGAFFEANDGSITKIGPTAIGVKAPNSDVGYGNGETWYDIGNGTLNVYSAEEEGWVTVKAPAFGGSVTALYVGSNYPEATDNLSNDGIARPFATLNRACIEVARRSILQQRVDTPFNAKFVIVLLPGSNVAYNEPGLSLDDFETTTEAFTENQEITVSTLRTFNSLDGGLILPRGTTVFGYDLRKTEIHPTYYPAWTRDAYESEEPIAARTGILKWTGNSYLNSLTFRDKISEVSVTNITGAAGEVAILTSLEPHGYRSIIVTDGVVSTGDKVNLIYPNNVSRFYDGNDTVQEEGYYADPINPTQFSLRRLTDSSTLIRSDLPEAPGPGTVPAEFLRLVYDNTTHHRLSSVTYAKATELNDFYIKVQRAFSTLTFGGAVNNADVTLGENAIVAEVPITPTPAVDTTNNASPYIYNVSVRSNFGLCGLTNNGADVTGFKSALTGNFTVVSLQNDADVYEVFYNGRWISLTQAYSIATGVPFASVSNSQALSYLISTVDVENFRFFYRCAKDIPDNGDLSSGLVDEFSDTRHYHTLCENSGLVQSESSFAVGTAISLWAKSGGTLTCSGANSSFGTHSIRSEGFEGIGTGGGAKAPNRDFTIQGIRRPARVSVAQLKDDRNHQHIFLNSSLFASSATQVVFSSPIDADSLFPFSLREGTVVWVEDSLTGTKYNATIGSNALSEDRQMLTVTSSTIPTDVSTLGVPYIRRFIDPRTDFEKSYALIVNNTSQSHSPPSRGSIIRYAEAPGSGAELLVTGRQLDPGANGGWNHTFSVQSSLTKKEGDNPNVTTALSVPTQKSETYYVTLELCDDASEWIQNTTETLTVPTVYQQGSYVTYAERSYYAVSNRTETGADVYRPDELESGWSRTKSTEYCLPVEEAYIGDPAYSATLDPKATAYSATATYLRGIPIDSADYVTIQPADYDNGTDTLGLEGSGNLAAWANPDYTDPMWSASYQAMTRFLNLLGYATPESLLLPQTWSNRNLLTSAFPSPSTEGYALTKGNWPVEFNKPSTIISSDHTWEYVGYNNYAKGLPEYQESPLTRKQKFDSILTEAWGGTVIATGLTESGDAVSTGITPVTGNGRIK